MRVYICVFFFFSYQFSIGKRRQEFYIFAFSTIASIQFDKKEQLSVWCLKAKKLPISNTFLLILKTIPDMEDVDPCLLSIFPMQVG